MSYTVSITRNDISFNDEIAWQQVAALNEQEDDEGAKDFISLINKLTERYPCICDLSEDKIDEGVWSDGPLVNNAGKNITTLAIVYSQADKVVPFLIETANRMGFVVFDYQSENIYRPTIRNNSI
jgi:hypothetical protein